MKKERILRLALYGGVGLLLAASLLFLLLPRGNPGHHPIATITVGSRTVQTVDLATAADGEFSILEDTGLPITFQVKDHAIRFLASDCPDKICVNTGFLRQDLDVASCLPNQVTLFVSVE